MRARVLSGLVLIATTTGCLKATPPGAQLEKAQLARRDVWLTLEAEVGDIPAGATELVLWIPVPRDERSQVLKQMTPDATARGAVVVDAAHRNPALRVLFPDPSASSSVKVTYLVSRVEERAEGPRGHPAGVEPAKDDPTRWLEEDPLAPVDDAVRATAGELFREGMDDDAKARAAASHAFERAAAGESCAAVHARFLALARAAGIPARLRNGFQVPESGPDGRLAGTVVAHCWAEWHSKKSGWVAVDVRRQTFGALDPHRVGMSLGHGTKFEGQTGDPIDAFVFPYAEIDGTPATVMTRATWFERK